MVNKNFERIERTISGFSEIINSQSVNKKAYNDKLGLITGDIEFEDESELSFMELKDTEQQEKKKYKYHYMDKNKDLNFRYDNAKHHPEIETHPHHKHTPSGIVPSEEPEIGDVLTEIEGNIKKKD